MKIYSKRPLYTLGGLLIDGKKNKHDFIALIDFSTGKERWTKDLGESKGGLGGLVKKWAASATSVMEIPPMINKDGNMVLVNKKVITLG